MTASLSGAGPEEKLDAAAAVLATAVQQGRVDAAALHVRHAGSVFERSFGAADSIDSIFLLASISKPISVAALMTLYDEGKFQLDDRVQQSIPQFCGDWRDDITIRHLLTHTSGLPDQLPENESLRVGHATLDQFVSGAMTTPILFAPGTRYSYSSMGTLLASEIARRISGTAFDQFVRRKVFQPLGMTRSALGLGSLRLDETVRCQVESAAPESGKGDPDAKSWDWNSKYWRELGSPWGGAHGSAPDVARFLAEFLHPTGKIVRPETARLMLRNHNAEGLPEHGLGFAIGKKVAGPGCSDQTFGHSGATGTLCWADPATDTICVVLTTLPSGAERPHPRRLASDLVVEAVARRSPP